MVLVKENLASQTCSWKGKIILYKLFRLLWVFFFDTTAKLSKLWFFYRFVCHVESKTISLFVLCPTKSVYPALWMHDTKHHMLLIVQRKTNAQTGYLDLSIWQTFSRKWKKSVSHLREDNGQHLFPMIKFKFKVKNQNFEKLVSANMILRASQYLDFDDINEWFLDTV